jgi:LemA protein
VTKAQIVLWVGGAALLFWLVGAYNRLVSLRGAIVRQFVPVEAQLTQRHGLLLQRIDALAPVLLNAAPRLDALRAACQQCSAACAHAKVRPGAAGAIASLRLSEDILGDARARLPVQAVAGIDLSALNAQLSAVDTTLGFARRQFNDAVIEYNEAVRQFPTVLIVGLFGFRAAATL